VISTSNSSAGVCEVAYVLDAAGFFASYHLLVNGVAYTTRDVIKEVRDAESLRTLKIGFSAGKVVVKDYSTASLNRVKEIASYLGELGRLSKTDLGLLALVNDLLKECKEVIVVSDDRSVQNVALALGARAVGIKRRELHRPRRYVYVCPSCGRVFKAPGRCPYCGVELRRVREDRVEKP
jgi:rRNA maturation endonuclease Nob1